MSSVKVLGYSERGIINSIVFYLREHSEQIAEFIPVLGINDIEFLKDCDYTFLNEQSFSDFGDNDWTIIAQKGTEKRVIFIEAKVKSFQGKYNIDNEFKKIRDNKNYKGVSSNIFAQLYYKYLLTKLQNDAEVKNSKVGKKIKKIGKNTIVQHAYKEYINGASLFYYVAILPIKEDDLSEKFKTLELKIYLANVKSVYWGNIEEFFKKIGAGQVIENFEYNKDQIY